MRSGLLGILLSLPIPLIRPIRGRERAEPSAEVRAYAQKWCVESEKAAQSYPHTLEEKAFLALWFDKSPTCSLGCLRSAAGL